MKNMPEVVRELYDLCLPTLEPDRVFEIAKISSLETGLAAIAAERKKSEAMKAYSEKVNGLNNDEVREAVIYLHPHFPYHEYTPTAATVQNLVDARVKEDLKRVA